MITLEYFDICDPPSLPRAVFFDANLDLLSFDQLRRWQRDGVPFTVIDADTDQDITQILLA
jgi:hypothetical protein